VYFEEKATESSGQRPSNEFVEVLRGLTHALSQPLTSLRGSLEVALIGEMDENECRKVLKQSLEETNRVAEVLATLREALEAEDPGDNFQPASWNLLVTRALEAVEPAAREKGLRFVLEPVVEVYVNVNPPRVDAALSELFRQVTRRGVPDCAIRIRLSVQKRTASLSVYGEGLQRDAAAPEEKTPTPAPATRAMEKTQLDWWILRRTIEGQGGWLEIEKIPPRGFCYRIYFPLASSETARPSSA
jgi:signal transduction histidine kinase